jgi:mannitol/fructose-specific phosphotransferase system IIA component (Ntr-type)
MFATKTSVLAEIFANPEWDKKLSQAKTADQVEKLIAEYCKLKGYKIETV